MEELGGNLTDCGGNRVSGQHVTHQSQGREPSRRPTAGRGAAARAARRFRGPNVVTRCCSPVRRPWVAPWFVRDRSVLWKRRAGRHRDRLGGPNGVWPHRISRVFSPTTSSRWVGPLGSDARSPASF